MRPYADQWAFLASIQPIGAHDIEPTILQATGGIVRWMSFHRRRGFGHPLEAKNLTLQKIGRTNAESLIVTLANLIYFGKFSCRKR